MLFKNLVLATAATLLLTAGAASAADPESCKEVRFSDVGWTDIQATTGIATNILKGLGYEPRVEVLAVPSPIRV